MKSQTSESSKKPEYFYNKYFLNDLTDKKTHQLNIL